VSEGGVCGLGLEVEDLVAEVADHVLECDDDLVALV
jgi:hypothetical protein